MSFLLSSPGNSPYRKKCLPWKKSAGEREEADREALTELLSTEKKRERAAP